MKINETEVPEGKCVLSGISRYSSDWLEDDGDAIMITLNDKNYVVGCDPSDGYRSYGIFMETTEKQKNPIPPQEVMVSAFCIDDVWELHIKNLDNEEIIVVTTDYFDAYYPVGTFEYNPHNLPINKEMGVEEVSVPKNVLEDVCRFCEEVCDLGGVSDRYGDFYNKIKKLLS